MRMCAGDARAEGDDEDDVALVDDSIRPRAELTRDAATDVNIHVGVTYMTRSYGGTSCLSWPARFQQRSSIIRTANFARSHRQVQCNFH